MKQAESTEKTFCRLTERTMPMTQNVWEQEAAKDLMQSEEWEAVRMSILSIGLERGMKKGVAWGIAKSILDILEETGPVSEKTREMILTETDAERLSAWVKKAARSNSEEDFLSKI